MNVLKTQFARIQQQFALLSQTQRMLAVALLVIMVMTVVYWGKYAATPERVALSDKSFGVQGVTLVSQLKAGGIAASLDGGKIMVPADQQVDAASILAEGGMIGTENADVFDKIAAKSTLWDSAERTSNLRNEMKQAVLGQVIRRFPGVAAATVILDPTERRSLMGGNTQARATVSIATKGGAALDKRLVQGAAQTVAGSQSNLPLANITVIVNGRPQAVQDPNDESSFAGASSWLEAKSGIEKFIEDKISGQLRYIHNPLISVDAAVNLSRMQEKSHEVDPKKSIQKEKSARSRTDESTQTSPSAAEPGAAPNTGLSVGAAVGAGSTSTTTNDEETKYENDWDYKDRVVHTPAGEGTIKSAAVRIPRSHFLGVWKALNPDASKGPDEKALEAIMTSEIGKIMDAVVAATNITDRARVVVSDYIEVAPEVAAPASAGVPVMTLVSGYGKEVALGVMALAAMAMVSGIVKKGGAGVPASVGAAAAAGILAQDERHGIDRLAGGHDIVGSATEGGGTLEAMELDEETSQTQQMVSQVSTMVKENPEAATALIKRWMARE